MNHLLEHLHVYPFEQLNRLLQDVSPPTDREFISLAMGEPRHEPPQFLLDLLADPDRMKSSLMTYPPTKGLPVLREAIAQFARVRYKLSDTGLDPDRQILPVNGSREALFAFAQAMLSPGENKLTLLPDPFYQIYEGAALLAGSQPFFLPCLESSGFNPDFRAIPDEIWKQTGLVYLCTPGNPTGAVLAREDLHFLIEKSLQYQFVIASDECYSEIYLDEKFPPTSLLSACHSMGLDKFTNCIVFNSLSKRSNLPGLRSGFVAGDAALIEKFLLYRTYHGSAMPAITQEVSAAAWLDEDHVIENRAAYREKFALFMDVLGSDMKLTLPDGGFYFWPVTPVPDDTFALNLFKEMNIKVLPGRYLSRPVAGINPGEGRIRIALVARLEECREAAERLKQFTETHY